MVTFHGESLELVFRAEQEHLLGLANNPRYSEPLQRVLLEHLGVRPHLQMGVADGAAAVSAPPLGGEPPPSGSPRVIADESKTAGTAGDPTGAAPGGASGGSGGDDVIRDQREIFEMARERLGSRDPGPES